jgi:hypothetical protein
MRPVVTKMRKVAMTDLEIETMEAYLEYAKAASKAEAPELSTPFIDDKTLEFRHMTGVWPSEMAHI